VTSDYQLGTFFNE